MGSLFHMGLRHRAAKGTIVKTPEGFLTTKCFVCVCACVFVYVRALHAYLCVQGHWLSLQLEE